MTNVTKLRPFLDYGPAVRAGIAWVGLLDTELLADISLELIVVVLWPNAGKEPTFPRGRLYFQPWTDADTPDWTFVESCTGPSKLTDMLYRHELSSEAFDALLADWLLENSPDVRAWADGIRRKYQRH